MSPGSNWTPEVVKNNLITLKLHSKKNTTTQNRVCALVSALPSLLTESMEPLYWSQSQQSSCGLSGSMDQIGNATLSPIRDCSVTVFSGSSMPSMLQVGHNGLETIQVSAYCLIQKYKALGQWNNKGQWHSVDIHSNTEFSINCHYVQFMM